MSKPTIQDVARVAGLSVKTLSRVINDDPKVNQVTKKKVLKFMDDMGYIPNVHARRLRTNKTYLIGIIYTDYMGYSYSHLLAKGAINACDKLFYNLILRPIDSASIESTLENIHSFIERSKLDGIILPAPLCNEDKVIALIKELNLPCVAVGVDKSPQIDSVFSSEVDGATKAINHLITLGHQDIAIIVNQKNTESAGKWRYQGYEKALEEAGVKIKSGYVQQYNEFKGLEEDCIRQLLQRPNKPSAIFAFNDGVAAKVYKIASQLGLRIPHDLSVVGFDNDPLGENLWPPLTTVHQPILKLGEQAAELLIRKCLQGNQDLNLELLDCPLILRNSTAPFIK